MVLCMLCQLTNLTNPVSLALTLSISLHFSDLIAVYCNDYSSLKYYLCSILTYHEQFCLLPKYE